MHDQALLRDLLREVEAVAAREGAARVAALHVRLGALSHMTPAHFEEHFRALAAGSLAADARLEVSADPDIHSPDAQHVVLQRIELVDP